VRLGYQFPNPEISLSQGWAKLKDWVSLLGTFNSLTSREKPAPTFPGTSNTHIKLFKWLSYFNDAKHTTKIKSNLVAAAIHLAFMRNHRFPANEVPELSGDLDALIAAQFSEVHFLSPYFIKINCKFSGKRVQWSQVWKWHL